jgi:hypothetical protein
VLTGLEDIHDLFFFKLSAVVYVQQKEQGFNQVAADLDFLEVLLVLIFLLPIPRVVLKDFFEDIKVNAPQRCNFALNSFNII